RQANQVKGSPANQGAFVRRGRRPQPPGLQLLQDKAIQRRLYPFAILDSGYWGIDRGPKRPERAFRLVLGFSGRWHRRRGGPRLGGPFAGETGGGRSARTQL